MQRRGVRRSHAFQQGLEKSPVTSLSPVDRLPVSLYAFISQGGFNAESE
jgi:hypothetical protein